jgi:transcriptional regulator with XRE-family HTH domain
MKQALEFQSPKYLGQVERGEKIISVEARLRIARALKTPIGEFFRGIDSFANRFLLQPRRYR